MTYDEIIKEREENIMMQRFRLVPGEQENRKEQHESNLRFLKLHNIPTSELWAVVGKPQPVPSDRVIAMADGSEGILDAGTEPPLSYRVNIRSHTRIELVGDLILIEKEYVEFLPEFETMDNIEIYGIPGPVNV